MLVAGGTVLLSALTACASPTLPTFGSATYTVPAATGNAATDTANLTAAINAIASNAAGGTVLVPAGSYLCNTLTMKSGVDLQLSAGAVLRDASPTTAGVIATSGSSLHDMGITGAGTIDGMATTATGTATLVSLSNVSRVLISGVTIQNSAHFHVSASNDSNVTIQGVRINDGNTLAANGGSYLSNTDGIDFSGSNYLIQNCTVSDGDDDICAKPQSTACSNIVIQNCAIGAGHGISVGGQTNDGLTNMLVQSVTFTGTTNGLRLKAGVGMGGTVSGVTFNSITMTGVANPIIVNSWYNGGDHYGSKELSSLTNPATFDPGNPGDPLVTVDQSNNTALYPFFQNLTYENITATGATSNVAIIYGLNSEPAQNIDGVLFNNVNLSGAYGADMFYVTNLAIPGLTVTAANGNALNLYGSDFPVVPEPSSAAIVGVAVVGAGMGRVGRRRR
jgi:polygalacturonase